MNARRPFQFLAACGMIALAAACVDQNESDHKHPRFSHDFVLTPARPTVGLVIERGAALRIILPGPPAGSDLAWEIVSNNTHLLEQTTALRVSEAPSAPTQTANRAITGRTTSVVFYALKIGKSVVRFVLVNPSDRDAVPKGHFEVTVVSKDPDE